MRLLMISALMFSALVAMPAAQAAQCRDAQGKFVKCQTKPVHCRDSSGKFVKCSAAGAVPG